MDKFNLKNLNTNRRWDYHTQEYHSGNPITQFLFNFFYKKLEEALMVLKSGDKILEVGCGAGESSLRIKRMLKDQYFEVSDIDEYYINKLKDKNFSLPVSQESVYDLKRGDNEFDCILFLEVLEHLKNPECALQELFRVSRKYVILSVPNEPLWRFLNLLRGKFITSLGNTPAHVNHWSVSEISDLVSRHGKIIKLYKPIPWIIIIAEKE